MRLEIGLDGVRRDPASVVTVGTFDGIHLGHQAILRQLERYAAQCGGMSTLVTFDPHPGDVVRGQVTPLLTTVEEKAAVLESLGLGRLVAVPFTRTFAALSAAEFVRTVLVDQSGMQQIVAGYDHGFGRGREGDAGLLRHLGARHGFGVRVVEAQAVGSRVVSSRMIRDLLRKQGDAAAAEALLGRPYALTGTVMPGAGRGRTLGFPTANLKVDNSSKLLPQRGVYAVRVHTGGELKGGMMNIGVRPTVEQSTGVHLEVHLFDFSGNLYRRPLTVEFAKRIRDEKHFESLEALSNRLALDEKKCRALVP